MCFSANVGCHFLKSNKVGRHFARVFRVFAQIFRDFSRIFDQPKLWVCTCTRTVASKYSIGELCVCLVGLDITKLTKTPLIYSVSRFNLGGVELCLGRGLAHQSSPVATRLTCTLCTPRLLHTAFYDLSSCPRQLRPCSRE